MAEKTATAEVQPAPKMPVTTKALKKAARQLGMPLRQFCKDLITGQFSVDSEERTEALKMLAHDWVKAKGIYVDDEDRANKAAYVDRKAKANAATREAADPVLKKPYKQAMEKWVSGLWNAPVPQRGKPVHTQKKKG